jgi:hypothetical protein
MDPKELRGLMEAYSEVYAPQEEIEEGLKPLPKEKMARQAQKAQGMENRAAAAGDEKETNRQMQRRIAMQMPSSRRTILDKKKMGEEVEIDEAVKGESSERRKDLAAERRAGHRPLSKKEGDANAAHMARKVRFADKVTKAKGHMPGYTYGEEVEIFDVVLEFLQVEGYAETLEEAEKMMANVLNVEAINIILGESQHARENPEKYEREQSKKSASVRGEKTPMPPRGDKRREDFEKWYAANVR